MYGCVWFSETISSLIILMTGPIMNCFFVLSGFSIRMSSCGRQLNDGGAILGFYKRRLLSILPAYYLLNICYAFIIEGQIKDALILFPIQLFGISAPFRNLFGTFATGGTWFVSCILIAYFLYPLIHQILSRLSGKKKLMIVVLLVFLREYSAKIDTIYGLETNYSNPFFRTMEFAVGVFLYDLLVGEHAVRYKKVFLGSCSGLLVLAVAYCLHGRRAAVNFLLSSYVLIILLFVCVLYLSLNLKCAFLERSKVLFYLSKLTYHLYLMQMLSWRLSDILFHPQTSLPKVACSFGISLTLSVVSERITWLVQNWLKKEKSTASLKAETKT